MLFSRCEVNKTVQHGGMEVIFFNTSVFAFSRCDAQKTVQHGGMDVIF